jgi:hypothetical protein
MKNGLMVVSTGVDNKINIGDYIQALAAKQFLPSVDVMLERETDLKDYHNNPVRMIMNGWYMNHPENWPPSEQIKPLFVALHINKCGLPNFLNQKSINYFKKHQPIGCRDTNSANLLHSKGVDAYFTGCLTLTLGYKYHSKKKNGKVYIVEPYSANAGLMANHKIIALKTFTYLLLHYFSIKKITLKKQEHGLKSMFYNAYFLKEYSKVFDYKMLVNAEYINQYNDNIQKEYPSQEDKLNYAETLIQKYAEAACVITSRIHCALPCLGLETPVIFVQLKGDSEYSTARFGGLINLFNVMTWNGLHLENIITRSKINISTFPKNKNDWKSLATNLITVCKAFVNQ